MVRKRLQRLGLVLPCYGPHALRHSCATHLLAEGLSLKEIADHLGHVSLAATQMYAKVDLTALREVGAFPVTWYREGKNVQRLLPHLSIYLGHGRLRDTQRYLSMTTELLQQASLCFERYARPEVPHA